ncbi:hypothetical protein G3N59_03955 [Paraburkholderia sp. Ac-20340]|uniref:hypothetical protein n=1 Tax=Paraburkholderia sp. Ac-20340 TaxID=2703888 RepID=UPI00197F1987|nr:hypothetical protein [Paraburkholderia sp. Ac-20340]MBN3852529.1 hypothetical protein [Paraburkholderia sp. Ac-20340]
MKDKSPIFFLHIPKTAGTSVTALIEDNLSLTDSFKLQEIRDSYYGNTLDYDLLKSARAVCGHIPLCISHLMDQPVRTLVFLRTPAELSFSMFNHLKRIGDIKKETSLAEFLDSPYAEVILNMQTKWLSGHQIPNIPIPIDRPLLNFEISFGAHLDHLFIPIDEQSLTQAKENLERISFIGILEKMQESMSALKSYFEFSRNPVDFSKNVGGHDKKIDDDILKQLTERNELDNQLYAFGRELFDQRVSNKISRVSLPEPARKSWVELDMNHAIRHDGLHHRELWPHWHGVRWTSDISSIELPCKLEPSVEYSYELVALTSISNPDIQTTQLSLDDVNLDYDLHAGTGVFQFRGVISSASGMDRPMLKIVAPYAQRPSDQSNSTDSRLLGLAIKSFRLKPVRACAIEPRSHE